MKVRKVTMTMPVLIGVTGKKECTLTLPIEFMEKSGNTGQADNSYQPLTLPSGSGEYA